MRWLREVVYVLRQMKRSRAEQDLDDEICGHLEREIADNIAAGMPPREARRAAHLAFGNVTMAKEDSRKMWGLGSIEMLWQDVRYGIRMLAATPGPTSLAIAALAIGIGANTAVFSIVYGVLLRSLPFPNPDRLVMVQSANARSGANIWGAASPADFVDWRARSLLLAGIVAERGTGVTIDFGGELEQFPAVSVSDDFFTVFNTPPLLGRSFAPEEFSATGPPAILLSYKLWRERFGGATNIAGQSIIVDGKPAIVAGVMPESFNHPESVSAWVPLNRDSGEMRGRGSRYFSVTARLKDGTTAEQAQAEMTAIATNLATEYPATNKDWGVHIAPLREALVGKFRPALLILLSAVGLVLLTACVNVANLQLARVLRRRREIAVREALGASRRRIIRQLLTESLMLSVIGAVLGLALTYWAVGAASGLVPRSIGLPRLTEVRVDGAVLLFTCAAAIATGVLFGLVPALQSSKLDLQASLRESSRSVSGSRALRRTRNFLVVGEMALTLMLLAGAGLLIRSFLRMQDTNNAFNPRALLAMPIPADLTAYGDSAKRANYFKSVLDRAAAVPGVQSASLNSGVPLGFFLAMEFSVDGVPPAPGDAPQAAYYSISGNYFKTMQTPLVAGREFQDQDNAKAPRVAIINESMRRQVFHGENPIGKRLKVNYLDSDLSLEIVGVTADIKQAILRDAPTIEIYVPYVQVPWLSSWLFVRTDGDPAPVSSSLRQAVGEVIRARPLPAIDPMDRQVSLAVAEPRFYAWLMAALALIALCLAGIGIYGIISHSVVERTHEIGVKMALGAQIADIIKEVMTQSTVLTAAGIVIGLSGAFAVTRLLSGILYGVSATDLLTFVIVPVILAAVALIATLIPARRAARVDPVIALRNE